MDFIDRLREKSSGTKKKIAFMTSAVVTLMIFGIWVSVLHFGVNPKSENATAAVANSSGADVNPLSAFWDVISKGWDGLANNINQVKIGVDQAKDFANTLNTVTPVATSTATSADVFILDNITQ
jgi:hypothetical protein